MDPLFDARLREITAAIGDRPVESGLAAFLNARFPADGEIFRSLSEACRRGVAEGWLCSKGEPPLRWGRVVKPTPEFNGFSVDVVDMDNVAGPHHSHPRGEIDMIMPLDEGAKFDGQGAGWMAYGAGSAHAPTVSGGRALVLYLLPSGEISFTRA